MGIPSTINDIIMARVDSLPEAAREVLQTGSVVEREFGYELIKYVTGLKETELLSLVSVLKDSELIYERGIFPQSTYIFKHALSREVVYDSIITTRKKRLHEEIANAIENLYKDNIGEHYEILAEHFITGGNNEKGAEYCRLAARKAEKAASVSDAVAYSQKRIASLEKLPQTDKVQKKLIDTRTTLGLYFLQISNFVGAKEAIDPIIELASQKNYKRRLSQIYTILGVYNNAIKEDFSKPDKQFDEAVKISEEMNDIISLVLANYFWAAMLSRNCEFEKAVSHFEKAIEINVAANNLWGISTMKSNLSFFVYDHQGYINLGYQTSQEALHIAEKSGDSYSKANAYMSHGFSCFRKGLLKDAEEYGLKGIDFCERINHPRVNAFAQCILGDTYFETGEYQKSMNRYNKGLWLSIQNKYAASIVNFYKICEAAAMVLNNEKDIELSTLFRYEAENKFKVQECQMRRLISEILLNIDDQHVNEAEDWIKKAIEASEANGMMWDLGRAHALNAEIFKHKGDKLKAEENLNKAIEILRECGADGWVKKYEGELAQL
jgi:tetratricopeptide (TPR) repeat protein